MKLPIVHLTIWVYLMALISGYVTLGWLLAAFQVSGLVWLGSLAVALHLVEAGADAIALATAWIVIVISAGAVAKAWTPIWHANLPHENAKAWAMGLLVLWLWAVVLAVGLGFAKQPMRSIGLERSHRLMLMGLALGGGGLIYWAVC
jgi:hypothetical protein